MPIEIPEWQDIIRLEDPRSLPADEQLRRRREIAQRIRASPTPEVARNVGSFLTFLDDIEDLISASILVGVSWLGLISRANPLVRGALTIGRAFDAARIISPLGLGGRNAKSYFERHRLQDPFDALEYVDRDAGIAELSRRFGPLLELGQAMETVFGVGLVLGPVVGSLNDLVFSTPLGVPLEWLYERIEPLTSTALNVLRASPLGWLIGQTFTPEEHVKMALGVALAWQIAGPWVSASPVDRTLGTLAERAVALPRPRHPATISVLADLAVPPTTTPAWPVPGEPTSLRPIDAAQHLLARSRATQAEIYRSWGNTSLGNLFFGTERLILRSAILSTSGGRPVLREGLSPQARLFAALLDSPPLPPDQLTPDVLEAILTRGGAVQEATGRLIPIPQDLRALKPAQPP